MEDSNKPIKVLVVDDSIVFREIISRALSSDPSIQVVAKAEDPFDARDKILKYYPDVMICDVEMPKMNGVEFIKRLLPQYPLPVIVVSALNDAVFEAMDAGAVDFICKPNTNSVNDVDNFLQDLISKVKVASRAKIKSYFNESSITYQNNAYDTSKIIAIGASTGGTEALFHILKTLPSSIPGIVIVQHIPPKFSKMFADRLDTQTLLNVKEAENGDYMEPGTALVAPGDQHVRIKRIGSKYKIECFKGEKVNGHCPSVDVLFESVAKEAGNNAVGIILTGMGNDGAKGLMQMRRGGALTLGQDENSCVVYGMPKVAFNIGAVEKQLPLNEIPLKLHSLLLKK